MSTSPEISTPAVPEKRQPLSKARLAIALGLVTFDAYMIWASEGLLLRFMAGPILIATLILMEPRQVTQPVPKSAVLWILAVLSAFVLFIVFFARPFSPDQVRQSELLQAHYSQAHFVIPAWALLAWWSIAAYRRSQRN